MSEGQSGRQSASVLLGKLVRAPLRLWRTPSVSVLAIAVVVAVGLLIVALFVLPDLLVEGSFRSNAEEQRARNDVRTLGVGAVGGIALLVGAVYAARNYLLNREGQITERFSRSVELLGSDKEGTRIGAIYALERIAQDSERDHWPIMETLAAVARGTTSAEDKTAFVFEPERTRGTDGQPEPSDGWYQHPTSNPVVQVVGSVLGRRAADRDPAGRVLDLVQANLVMARMTEARLDGAFLVEANLENASLFRAQLRRAVLQRASLRYAYLVRASLDEAQLQRASLRGAKLQGASLVGADFLETRLEAAQLHGADLTSAKNLEAARLHSAKYDQHTKWPQGFSPSQAGARPTDG